MKRMYSGGILLLGMLGAVAAMHAESTALRGTAMLSCSGMPCVDVTLKSGKHLRMLVDLGDAHSIVDSATAKELGLAVQPTEVMSKEGKAIEGFGSATLEGAKLGDASLGDVPVLVSDLASHVQKGQIPQADGVLAYTVFRDRLLQMDFKRHLVRISDPLTAKLTCGGFCGDVTTPTFGKNGPPILVTTGFSVNGKPITAQIDTMYIGTMLIYPEAIAKLDLSATSGVNATQFFKYTDGGVSMREGKARSESFGSKALAHNVALFFTTPQVHQADGLFDGTVGLGLLNGHVVNIDLHSQHFWLTN
jgi:hypothetical protein